MKKKIVIKVQMKSDRSRSKALKIAAGAEYVQSVGIEGEAKDKVVITGEGVDSIKLTESLRKKVGFANIESVQDVKPPEPPKTTPSSDTKPADIKPADTKPADPKPADPAPQNPPWNSHIRHGEIFGYVLVDDDPPPPGQCCQM